MLAVVRMFRSEEQAHQALDALAKRGFTKNGAYLLKPHTGDAAQVAAAAHSAGQIPGSHIGVCQKALQAGHYVVSVDPFFGTAKIVEDILDQHDPVPTELPEFYTYNPAPLSEILGLPVLTKYKHSFNIKQITRSGWFATSPGNGDGLISKKATPLSSIFGMKTLTANKSKTSSFGLPLLSKNPTPLSSMFGMKAISSNKSKNSSFGFRTLSKNPAPLSNMFNIPVLSKRSDDD